MVKDTLLSSATNSEQATPLVPLEFDRGSITLPVAVERGAMELNSCAEINRYTLGSDGRSAAIALGSKVIAIQAAQRTLRNFLTFSCGRKVQECLLFRRLRCYGFAGGSYLQVNRKVGDRRIANPSDSPPIDRNLLGTNCSNRN